MVLEEEPDVDATEEEPPELELHRRLQKRLEETRIVAIMDPSPANLREYMFAQREVMDRSATFADVWQRVLWSTPALDYQFTHRPVNAAALHTWERERREVRDERIADAAADHGLFFVFGGDCAHCAQMAATLSRFSERHGFAVQAVAVGGASHPAFPDAWPDNGFAANAGVDRYPALVMARLVPGEGAAFPVGFGALAETDIEQRVAILTAVPVGERF